VKYPPDKSFVLTKADASLRHIEAAIAAFDEGHFDVAITLAGAAEGMAPGTAEPALFTFLRDQPMIDAEGIGRKEWSDVINVERNWLKHTGPDHPPTMTFDRSSAAIMLLRATSKAHASFGLRSEAIKAFELWMVEHIDDF
jgi:hypothetical protein